MHRPYMLHGMWNGRKAVHRQGSDLALTMLYYKTQTYIRKATYPSDQVKYSSTRGVEQSTQDMDEPVLKATQEVI